MQGAQEVGEGAVAAVLQPAQPDVGLGVARPRLDQLHVARAVALDPQAGAGEGDAAAQRQRQLEGHQLGADVGDEPAAVVDVEHGAGDVHQLQPVLRDQPADHGVGRREHVRADAQRDVAALLRPDAAADAVGALQHHGLQVLQAVGGHEAGDAGADDDDVAVPRSWRTGYTHVDIVHRRDAILQHECSRIACRATRSCRPTPWTCWSAGWRRLISEVGVRFEHADAPGALPRRRPARRRRRRRALRPRLRAGAARAGAAAVHGARPQPGAIVRPRRRPHGLRRDRRPAVRARGRHASQRLVRRRAALPPARAGVRRDRHAGLLTRRGRRAAARLAPPRHAAGHADADRQAAHGRDVHGRQGRRRPGDGRDRGRRARRAGARAVHVGRHQRELARCATRSRCWRCCGSTPRPTSPC